MSSKNSVKKAPRRLTMILSIPIRANNAGVKVSVKKANAQAMLKKIIKRRVNGKFWDVTSFKWKGPIKPAKKRYQVTIRLVRNKKNPGSQPPKEGTVAKPTTPPPSM